MNTFLDIEKASYVSWPAFEEEDYRGWQLRYADGCTKRSNSANAITPLPGEDIARSIDYCELFFRKREQPTIFRIPSFVENLELDHRLADRGYSLIDPSLVLHMPMGHSKALDDEKPSLLDRGTWLDIYDKIHAVSPAKRALHARLIDLVPEMSLFTVRKSEGVVVACGLGVIHNGYFGIFDIITRPENRRCGHGSHLIAGMLSWAHRNGARHAYVQVMAHNAPAIGLYEKLGYRRAYDYWYRIEKTPAT